MTVQRYFLNDMVRGWFVGDFAPAALRLNAAEVAVQHFRAGDVEPMHEHRVATEVTLLLSGRALMCGQEIGPGEILVLEPGTRCGFEALQDCITVVVKSPSVIGDKHVVHPTNTTETSS